MLKVDLRKQLLKLRKELQHKLPHTHWGELQLSLLEVYLGLPREQWHQHYSVYGYVPFQSELRLMGPWAQHWLCPKVVGQTMTWFPYGDGVPGYEKNRFGILERVTSQTPASAPRDKSLILAPGIACNRQGFRIGYGGGYYDRFLARHPAPATTVFPTLDELVMDESFQESHDIPVDVIVTQSKIITI